MENDEESWEKRQYFIGKMNGKKIYETETANQQQQHPPTSIKPRKIIISKYNFYQAELNSSKPSKSKTMQIKLYVLIRTSYKNNFSGKWKNK